MSNFLIHESKSRLLSAINAIQSFRHLNQFLVFLFFVICAGHNILSHPLWRDETDAWLVARDSTSITNLLNNVKYTGRPPLWYLVLYCATRLSVDVKMLQVITFLITGMVVALIVFLLICPLTLKILMLSGFYFLFGFSVLSRDYSIILLFVVLLSILFQRQIPTIRKLTLILLICFPLSSVNIFGVFIALSVLASIILPNLSLEIGRAHV